MSAPDDQSSVGGIEKGRVSKCELFTLNHRVNVKKKQAKNLNLYAYN